jgi:hypothetical protein
MELYQVKKIQFVHIIIFTIKSVFIGFFPSHHFDMRSPHTINPELKNPQINPQTSTLTRDNPYGSISDINTPHKKLLNRVKNIKALSPEIERIILIVPDRSIFFHPSSN